MYWLVGEMWLMLRIRALPLADSESRHGLEKGFKPWLIHPGFPIHLQVGLVTAWHEAAALALTFGKLLWGLRVQGRMRGWRTLKVENRRAFHNAAVLATSTILMLAQKPKTMESFRWEKPSKFTKANHKPSTAKAPTHLCHHSKTWTQTAQKPK